MRDELKRVKAVAKVDRGFMDYGWNVDLTLIEFGPLPDGSTLTLGEHFVDESEADSEDKAIERAYDSLYQNAIDTCYEREIDARYCDAIFPE